MRYFYEFNKPNIPLYGKIFTNPNAYFRSATLYLAKGKGLCVIQQHYDRKNKCFYWSNLEYSLANDIYLNAGFKAYFDKYATATDARGLYFTVSVRRIMWALRMKPLKKEEWECDIYGCEKEKQNDY